MHLSEKFESKGHKVLRHNGKVSGDLSNFDEIIQLTNIAKDFGVNVLVNNAAIVCPNITFENYDTERINKMIDVNLRAPILLSYFLCENLTNIININSMVGLEIKSPRTLYSATKWGLRGFSNSYKKENSKISILDVYPTNIKTIPNRKNAMDIDLVVGGIYQAFLRNQSELILDGRKR